MWATKSAVQPPAISTPSSCRRFDLEQTDVAGKQEEFGYFYPNGTFCFAKNIFGSEEYWKVYFI
jgi:hypothetical protein